MTTHYLRNTDHTGDTISREAWDEFVRRDNGEVRHATATDEPTSDYAYHAGDGCGIPGDMIARDYHPVTIIEPSVITIELSPEDDNETPPAAPVDPLEAWEAGLLDAEAVRAAMWQAADDAADNAGACSEYEETAAHPHGHPGRPDKSGGMDDYGQPTGAGTVTYRRDVYRTVRVTQEMTVPVDAGEDAWEVMRETWDWEDIHVDDYSAEDTETDDGPEVYDINRESEPELGEVTMPAALVRAALESGTEWRTVRDALLETARNAGAPIRPTFSVDLAADISRWSPDTDGLGGAWAAPSRVSHRGIPATERQHQVITQGTDSAEAYQVAHRLIATQYPDDRGAPRVMFPTLSGVARSAWGVITD